MYCNGWKVCLRSPAVDQAKRLQVVFAVSHFWEAGVAVLQPCVCLRWGWGQRSLGPAGQKKLMIVDADVTIGFLQR